MIKCRLIKQRSTIFVEGHRYLREFEHSQTFTLKQNNNYNNNNSFSF